MPSALSANFSIIFSSLVLVLIYSLIYENFREINFAYLNEMGKSHGISSNEYNALAYADLNRVDKCMLSSHLSIFPFLALFSIVENEISSY